MRCTIDDREKIQRVLEHPDVFKWMADDYANLGDVSRAVEVFLTSPKSIYVLMPVEGLVRIFIARSTTTYEGHGFAIPEIRGAQATTNGIIDGLQWMFKNTEAKKIFAFIPDDNKRAIRFAHKVGYKTEGVLTKSLVRDGKLYDQILVGVTKEEFSEWVQH